MATQNRIMFFFNIRPVINGLLIFCLALSSPFALGDAVDSYTDDIDGAKSIDDLIIERQNINQLEQNIQRTQNLFESLAGLIQTENIHFIPLYSNENKTELEGLRLRFVNFDYYVDIVMEYGQTDDHQRKITQFVLKGQNSQVPIPIHNELANITNVIDKRLGKHKSLDDLSENKILELIYSRDIRSELIKVIEQVRSANEQFAESNIKKAEAEVERIRSMYDFYGDQVDKMIVHTSLVAISTLVAYVSFQNATDAISGITTAFIAGFGLNYFGMIFTFKTLEQVPRLISQLTPNIYFQKPERVPSVLKPLLGAPAAIANLLLKMGNSWENDMRHKNYLQNEYIGDQRGEMAERDMILKKVINIIDAPTPLNRRRSDRHSLQQYMNREITLSYLQGLFDYYQRLGFEVRSTTGNRNAIRDEIIIEHPTLPVAKLRIKLQYSVLSDSRSPSIVTGLSIFKNGSNIGYVDLRNELNSLYKSINPLFDSFNEYRNFGTSDYVNRPAFRQYENRLAELGQLNQNVESRLQQISEKIYGGIDLPLMQAAAEQVDTSINETRLRMYDHRYVHNTIALGFAAAAMYISSQQVDVISALYYPSLALGTIYSLFRVSNYFKRQQIHDFRFAKNNQRLFERETENVLQRGLPGLSCKVLFN